MTHAPRPPPADLWSRAAVWFDAFAQIFGDALKIARRWRMTRADIVAALKALAPVESLARRLVFAQALGMRVKLRPPRARLARRVQAAPGTITLDAGAYRRAMLRDGGLVRLTPPHPLDGPPSTWPARFCVARFAPAMTMKRIRTATPATAPSLPRAPTIALARNRRSRRAGLTKAQARAAAEEAWLMGAPDAPIPPPPAPSPAHDPWALLSSARLACRVAALERVCADPARAARALARRLARAFVDAGVVAARVLARARTVEDAHANAHIRAALAPDSS